MYIISNQDNERELFRIFSMKCYENAVQFLQDAELLFNNQSYGHTQALLVLGFEEWIKFLYGVGLYLGYLKLTDIEKKTDKEFSTVMKLHESKQRNGLAFGFACLYIPAMKSPQLEENILILTQEIAKGTIGEERNKLKVQRLIQQTPAIIKQDISNFIEIVFEWNANRKIIEKWKQSGFYVDFNLKDFLITSPQDIFNRTEVEKHLKTYIQVIKSTSSFSDRLRHPEKYNEYIQKQYKAADRFRKFFENVNYD